MNRSKGRKNEKVFESVLRQKSKYQVVEKPQARRFFIELVCWSH